ncbi:MAG: hypothetical protein JJ863_17475 [Deltaproteobacteria bacterium]|nr:hypothetical protein [Deltaproteobacteria bacterium]
MHLLLAAQTRLRHAVVRASRLMDLGRYAPQAAVRIEMEQSNGEKLVFVEFAGAGELTSEVLRRWYDRMTREQEVPAHVREFLDFVFMGAMEQWDTETC